MTGVERWRLLQNEISRLEAEVARLSRENVHLHAQVAGVCATGRALERELERVAGDSARLDWLEAGGDYWGSPGDWAGFSDAYEREHRAATLREAIDKAMAEPATTGDRMHGGDGS